MSNTPASIFELGQMMPEVRQFIDLWQNGRIDWNTCLLEMHKALVQRCIELDDKWNVGLNISEQMFAISEILKPSPFYFGYSLEEQRNIIQAIHIVANMLHHLLDFAKRTAENRHISQIMCYKDGRVEVEHEHFPNSEVQAQTGESRREQDLGVS